MIKVELHLMDAQEAAWFATFSDALMQYRAQKRRAQQAEFHGIDATPEPEAAPEAEVEPGEEPEPQVVGHIEPAAPTLAELTATVQASLAGENMAAQVLKVKRLLEQYGAKVLSEVPEDKRAELIGSL